MVNPNWLLGIYPNMIQAHSLHYSDLHVLVDLVVGDSYLVDTLESHPNIKTHQVSPMCSVI